MYTYFFDLDGTLTDSRDGLFKCFRAGLDELGFYNVDDSQLGKYLGIPLPRMFKDFNPAITSRDIQRAIGAFRHEYKRSGVEANQLYDGVLKMLDAVISKDACSWVVTAKPQPFAERVINYLEIGKYIQGIVGAGLDETDTKSSLLAKALWKSEASIDESIMLGDRGDDIIAAIENKIVPVGAIWGYAQPDELAKAGCENFVDSPTIFKEYFIMSDIDINVTLN